MILDSRAVDSKCRGDRLRPSRFSRLYWHLRCLRVALERVIREDLVGVADARLLDAGCGNMPYRTLFRPRVSQYLGCDLGGNELAHLHFTPEGRVPIEDGSIDVVLSSQVLEHVPDPVAYLIECRRVLRHDGVLVLSTHGVWRYHPDPTDYWRWTGDGLVKVIADRGFEVVRIEGVVGPAAAALQIWQDAVLNCVPRALRGAFTFCAQTCMRLADRRCTDEARQRDAGTYVVVARRGSTAG